MDSAFYIFMDQNNKIFCTMQRFPGPLNNLLKAAFASNVKGMNISNYPLAQRGDIWDGNDFIKMSDPVPPETEERIALLVENEIVDILDLHPDYPYYDKWIKGFDNPHTGMDATGYENVISGATWNGEMFILPDNVN